MSINNPAMTHEGISGGNEENEKKRKKEIGDLEIQVCCLKLVPWKAELMLESQVREDGRYATAGCMHAWLAASVECWTIATVFGRDRWADRRHV